MFLTRRVKLDHIDVDGLINKGTFMMRYSALKIFTEALNDNRTVRTMSKAGGMFMVLSGCGLENDRIGLRSRLPVRVPPS